jgi:hypothetical protein
MADFPPPPDSRRRLLAGVPRPPIAPPALGPTAGFDDGMDTTLPWAADKALHDEMHRLQAGLGGLKSPDFPANADFPDLDTLRPGVADGSDFADLSAAPGRRDVTRPTPLPGALTDFSDLAGAPATDAELDRLRAENAELGKLLDEMKQILEEASAQEQKTQLEIGALKAREQGLTGQLQLLTNQIHELELHITEQEESHKPPPNEEELSKLADELEQEQAKLCRERKALDEDRQNLRDDEEAMMKQMRDMEVTMAKERAELARQRMELQRLHDEIRRELESLQRADGALSSRLAQFQRRHQDVLSRGNNGTAGAGQPAQGGGVGRLFKK